jgi:hypothetical protein
MRTTFVSGFLAAALVAVAAGCHCCQDGNHNESADVFRSVSVPAEAMAGTAAVPEGGSERIVRQSYTLDMNGQFTLNRSVENDVGSLGLELAQLDRTAAERLGMEAFSGVLVRSVVQDGPAGRAGVKPDDVILSYGGKGVVSFERLELLVEESAPGQRVEFTYRRGADVVNAALEVGTEKRIESGSGFQQQVPVLDDVPRTGLRLAQLTPEARAAILGPAAGSRGLLVIEVLPGSPAFFEDVRVRDLVVAINGEAVPSLEDCRRVFGAAPPGTEATFTVERDRQELGKVIEIVENARDVDNFYFLGLLKYKSRPEGTEFGLLFDWLFSWESCYSVRKAETATRNVRRSCWGTALNLLHWQGTSGGKKELRLLWFFPIAWGGS